MICVGDIHGSYKVFQKLLKEFPNDQIALVGDLVDRGPQSVDVVQFVMDNSDRIKCVKGNHELMMLEFYEENRRASVGDFWLGAGGLPVYNAYRLIENEQKLVNHLHFLKNLPNYLAFPNVEDEDGRYLMVSHSIAINKDLDACAASQSLFWGRDLDYQDVSNGEWFNVFGHTPLEKPFTTDWWANIDTGACYGGYLTALRYPEMEVTLFKNEL